MQINVSNISVEYDGTPVIYQADFVIHENEKIALIGRNGCGKTTLMNMLSGIYFPDHGEIEVHGKPVTIRSPKDSFGNALPTASQSTWLSV